MLNQFLKHVLLWVRSDGNGNGKDVTEILLPKCVPSGRCFIELICETIQTAVSNTDTDIFLVTARLFRSTDDYSYGH